MRRSFYSVYLKPLLALLFVLSVSLACLVPTIEIPNTGGNQNSQTAVTQQANLPNSGAQSGVESQQAIATQGAIPTLPAAAPAAPSQQTDPVAGAGPNGLVALHDRLAGGVVNIRVAISSNGQTGEGAGSGFIIDDAGHIITNNHVVQDATQVVVVFYNNIETVAKVVGTDDDSDLAVIKVDSLPDGVHPLPLGDSDQVKVGEWVIAIGNPFGLSSSMTVGIVSAIGRTIESGVTPFSIPQAIQTDAAINPGNSGGPLINMAGQVIGVNAQIASDPNIRANAGVGFAIPSNVVRLVAPVLIEQGVYEWPWLGVQGGPVNLNIAQANHLDNQKGAYIDAIVPNGPAADAGLQGSTQTVTEGNVQVPAGGDIVIEADGNPINNFSDLLVYIAFKHPGDQVNLTVLRNGQRLNIPVKLEARPQSFTNNNGAAFP